MTKLLLTINRGEILGLAGLMGAGRTEVLEALFGVTKIDAGEVTVKGRKLEIKSPADAIAAGMGLLTEDRKKTGIMGVLSVRDNMVVASLARFSPGFILRPRMVEAAAKAERDALESYQRVLLERPRESAFS